MPQRYARRTLAPVIALASLAALSPAPPAFAQTTSQDAAPSAREDGMRSAGNEARFRVIQRFDRSTQPTDVEVQAQAGWPFPPAARKAVSRSDWKAALAAMASPAETELSEEFRFLKGYLAHRAGEHAAALALLRPIADASSLLADHARHYAAVSAFETGQFSAAAGLAARVTEDSLLRGPAVLLMASALVRDGKSELGIRGLRGYLARWSSGARAAEARLSLADALVATGELDEAALLYDSIRWRHPLSKQRSEAEQRLRALDDKLSAATKKKLASPSAEDQLAEHRERFAAHQSEAVVDALPKVLETWPTGSEERCEALYLIARSYTKLRKHAEASPWYERLITECPASNWQLKALYLGGKGFWNEGKQARAASWFEKIWTDYSEHSFADDAMYFVARIRREQEDSAAARKLLERQVERYPAGDMASDAHWLLVRQMFSDKEHEKIVAYVDALKEHGEQDLYAAGRLAYFRARALQKLGKAERAREGYTRVATEHPLSYYALLALNRLNELGEASASALGSDLCTAALRDTCARLRADALSTIEVPDALRSEPAFQRGMLFLQIELTDLARDEFRRLERSLEDAPEQLWALAWLLHQARAYPLSHDLPRRRIEDWKTSYPKDPKDPRWSVAYPTPFADTVQKWSTARNLPVPLIYAIMREESGFNPQVRSWAGALGLMQLMPATAKTLASAEGLPLKETELFEPDTAVRLGSAYLADLSSKVAGHPVLTIAGYNAGYGNLSNWLGADAARDLDLWVEDIPYGQTRNYAKRVSQTFWIYAWLYGEDAVPRLSMTLP